MKHKILLTITALFIIIALTGCIHDPDAHDCLEWECTYLNEDNVTYTTIIINEPGEVCQSHARVDCIYKDNCLNAPLASSECIRWQERPQEPKIWNKQDV